MLNLYRDKKFIRLESARAGKILRGHRHDGNVAVDGIGWINIHMNIARQRKLHRPGSSDRPPGAP